MNWHVVLRRGWQDISGFITGWLDEFTSVVVADHTPDEETKSPHCHLIILGYHATSKNNPQRDKYSKLLPDWRGRGEHSWMDRVRETQEPVTLEGGLKYILKGGNSEKARLVYNKGVSQEAIDEAMAAWVVYAPPQKENLARRAWVSCMAVLQNCEFNAKSDSLAMADEITKELDRLGYDFSMSKRAGMINSLISAIKPHYAKEYYKRLTIPKPEWWGDDPW